MGFRPDGNKSNGMASRLVYRQQPLPRLPTRSQSTPLEDRRRVPLLWFQRFAAGNGILRASFGRSPLCSRIDFVRRTRVAIPGTSTGTQLGLLVLLCCYVRIVAEAAATATIILQQLMFGAGINYRCNNKSFCYPPWSATSTRWRQSQTGDTRKINTIRDHQ